MPVTVADRKVYVNTKGTQTVKVCTAANKQGQYERYYRLSENHAFTQGIMEDRVAQFRSIPDLEQWLVNDRKARRERDNEAVLTPPRRAYPPQDVQVPEDEVLVEDVEDFSAEGGPDGEPPPVDAATYLESHDRRTALDRFIKWCRQPHIDHFDLSRGRANEIANHYFARIRALPDSAVFQVLGIMIAWIRHQTEVARSTGKHIPIDEWKGCCTGIADILLRPKNIDGLWPSRRTIATS